MYSEVTNDAHVVSQGKTQTTPVEGRLDRAADCVNTDLMFESTPC